MHATLYFIAATTTTVAGKKSTSSSSLPLLIIVVLFAGAYFLFIRPRSQRMRQQQAATRQLEIGDDVVTAGGIHGRLVGIGDDTVEVEVSPGVVLTFLRRAVNAKPNPGGTASTQASDPHDDRDDSYGDHDDHDHSHDAHDSDGDHLGPPPQASDHEPDDNGRPG
ncbi:MAG TPA: preprotein translocase subunit YajC [Acidimicrobiales bacterium]|nr:preprotein translocase subunit YajC [Acidimicrobiales bacterium]